MNNPKKINLQPLITVSVLIFALRTSATVRYVNLNSPGAATPYTSWATAATNIQDAINTSVPGDQILVTNGVYQAGAKILVGGTSNLVTINRLVTVRSVNGPAATILRGYQQPGTNNSPNAIRCVYMNSGATLSGFTLTNGMTYNESGGGVYCFSTNEFVTNCIIAGNIASQNGGGAFSGTLINCVLVGNSATNFAYGGGAYQSTLINCALYKNRVGYRGGGAGFCTLINCTLVNNFSHTFSGGIENCTLKNSIVYYNLPSNYDSSQPATNCCIFPLPFAGKNNFTNAPALVDLTGGNLRLQIGSPGIDAGTNDFVATAADLDDNPRVFGNSVDVGAYENQFQGTIHYVSLSSTNPVSPYTNWPTAATNIQDAVSVAQAGEFVVANAGVYTNSSVVIFGAETNRVALTNAITLLGLYGAQATGIHGGTQTRCVYIGSNSVLDGFTLANGRTRNAGNITNEQSGGGIWCETGGSVSNCVLTGNFALGGRGGGIYGGTIFNCTISNNIAFAGGGGAASANIFNSILVTNQTSGTPSGGGIYLGMASNCVFTANFGYFGGGAAYQSTLYNCVLNTNVSSLGGGGAHQSRLYNCILNTNAAGFAAGGAQYCFLTNCTLTGNHGNTGGTSSCTNYNCTFVGNSGPDGGGSKDGILFNCILTGNYSPNGGGSQGGTLYNCLLYGNKALSGGGAYNATLANCTIVGNTATNNAGGIAFGYPANCIIYFNNQTGVGISNCFSSQLISCCTFPNIPGTITTNDPLFVNFAGNDFHLHSNSPCINAGRNIYATNTDLDGLARIAGIALDLGAYEYQSPASIIPSYWLWQYGLATDGTADSTDVDGDGMSNWQEWRSSTIPTNNASLLKMLSISNSIASLTVSWQSVIGNKYYLQRSTNLISQPAFTTILTNLTAVSTLTLYQDNDATNSDSYFYRVGVQ